MIGKPLILDQMSGSVGGLVFSHNKGGAYVRARATPTNPNTILQQGVRSAMGWLSDAWLNQLTADQRTAWETYADNVPLINRIGAPRFVSGLAHFVRSNTPRQYLGLGVKLDAPTTFNLGEFMLPTVTYAVSTDSYYVAYDSQDSWVGEGGAYLLCYASRQQDPTINYFKGPYQALGNVAGDDETPPTPPADFPAIFPVALNNRGFLRFNVTRNDGRLSLEARTFCTAQP